jgi:hypothetical protein
VYNTEIDVKISQIISLKYLFLGNVPVIDNLATTLILNYDDDVATNTYRYYLRNFNIYQSPYYILYHVLITKMPEDKSLTDNGLV